MSNNSGLNRSHGDCVPKIVSIRGFGNDVEAEIGASVPIPLFPLCSSLEWSHAADADDDDGDDDDGDDVDDDKLSGVIGSGPSTATSGELIIEYKSLR